MENEVIVEEHSNFKKISLILIVLIVLVLAVGGYFIYSYFSGYSEVKKDPLEVLSAHDPNAVLEDSSNSIPSLPSDLSIDVEGDSDQ